MPLARETIMWLMVSDTCSFHLHHLRPKMGYGKPVYSPPKECQHHPAFWDTVNKNHNRRHPRQDVTCGFRDLVVTALQMDPVVNEAEQLAVQVLAPSGGCGVVEQDEQIGILYKILR